MTLHDARLAYHHAQAWDMINRYLNNKHRDPDGYRTIRLLHMSRRSYYPVANSVADVFDTSNELMTTERNW